jgi:hypothetical protein
LGDNAIPAFHCVKYVNGFAVDDIIHDFQRVAHRIKADNDVFVDIIEREKRDTDTPGNLEGDERVYEQEFLDPWILR